MTSRTDDAIASSPNHKAEVFDLLGHRVFVTAGTYRSEGEGVVEADRGVGTLRMLEVRMSYRTIQVVSIDNIQLIEGRSQ